MIDAECLSFEVNIITEFVINYELNSELRFKLHTHQKKLKMFKIHLDSRTMEDEAS